MKTIKKVPIELIYVEFMPPREEMKFGELYYSKKYQATNHLCLCGCGVECFLPLGPDDWQLIIKDGKSTITPSILQRFACQSHYIITNGIANFV